MNRILLVEDDAALSGGISLALQNNQTEVVQARTLRQARESLAAEHIRLVILDINLPDGNGLDFLREIRQRACPQRTSPQGRNMPVILLTANDMETDVVTGLESGADDYITKPFSLAVLRARVNTQLRKEAGIGGRYEQDGFVFDFAKMEFFKDTIPMELSKTEQKLLYALLECKGATMERGILVDRIWTDGAEYVDENALSVTIKRLRDKLESNPSKPVYIKTVYGLGYTWAVK